MTHASAMETVPVLSEDVIAKDDGEAPKDELRVRYCRGNEY